MKKILSKISIFALAFAVCFAFVGCGMQNDYITASTGAKFSGVVTEFKNAEDFKLVYLGDNNYKAEGSANTMNAEQASAWGTVEGSKFVVVNVKMGVGGTSIVGWRSEATKDTAYEPSEIDGSLIKNSTAANETKNYILALSDGTTPRHPELKVWRIEVTEKDATEMVAYTIDFSALYE